jgi:hypothetical protein
MKLSDFKMNRKIVFCGLCVFLLGRSVGRPDFCHPDPTGNPQPPHTLKDVLASAEVLRKIDDPNKENLQLIKGLSDLRGKMEAYALECLNEDAKKNLPISHTQNRIDSDFKKVKLDGGGETDKTGPVFADACRIELGPIDPETGYLPFKSTIGILCGKEMGFAILQKNGNEWVPILCDFIMGANSPASYLKYNISRRKDEGADYVAVARLSTGCQSNWQGTQLTVIRIKNGWSEDIYHADIPTVTTTDSDNDLVLNPLPKGFSIKVQNGDGGDEPGSWFPHTYNFTIENGMVSNIAIQAQPPAYK